LQVIASERRPTGFRAAGQQAKNRPPGNPVETMPGPPQPFFRPPGRRSGKIAVRKIEAASVGADTLCACDIASDGAIRGRLAGEGTVNAGLVHTRSVGAEFVGGATSVIHAFNAISVDAEFVGVAIINRNTPGEANSVDAGPPGDAIGVTLAFDTISVDADFVWIASHPRTRIDGITAVCEDRRYATQKDTNPK